MWRHFKFPSLELIWAQRLSLVARKQIFAISLISGQLALLFLKLQLGPHDGRLCRARDCNGFDTPRRKISSSPGLRTFSFNSFRLAKEIEAIP